jgi:two-component system cell cycle response regulator DivK
MGRLQCSQAQDAEEALDVIKTSPPDLILMDIALPCMDGLTLTRKLKADPATSQISVIALTAYAHFARSGRPMAETCEEIGDHENTDRRR